MNQGPEAEGAFAPDGHFYSPVHSLDEVRARAGELFKKPELTVPGVDLNRVGQFESLEILRKYYSDQPFAWQPTDGLRYFGDNSEFRLGDAFVLYAFLRELRPRRVVEIGSGYSTCAMLDTAELFLDGDLELTCVEPHPQRLLGALREGDLDRLRLVHERVQDVDRALFEGLGEGDILFIDSSHVSKIGSDVNHLFFDVLPRLASGTYVHVHDVLYPFEYPRDWVLEGRAWNEAYLVRAFLQYNRAFTVAFWGDYLVRLGEIAIRLEREMPRYKEDTGTSLWLRKR